MISRFQDKKLSFQIYIILAVILGIFSILLTIIIPMVLRYSFTKETYARLEDHQEFIIKYKNNVYLDRKVFKSPQEPPPAPPFLPENGNHDHPPPSFRVIEHFFIDKDGGIQGKLGMKKISEGFLEGVIKNIKKQKLETRQYQTTVNRNIYFYVIRMVEADGKKEYLVSYLEGKYRDNLVNTVFKIFMKIIGFVLIISWIASIFIAKYLTKPLTQLQQNVKEIARKNWNKPIIFDRGDEIGQLAETIEWMRKKIVTYNKKQQDFLQQVSHELKTPVMVIQNYTQSIKDGIFPRGDLENSLKIIEEQTDRLKKRIHFLLSFTKYEYLSNHQLKEKEFDLAELIEKTANDFMWRDTEINWEIDIIPAIIKGDQEKFGIVLENIFENQIRYAKKYILVKVEKNRELLGQTERDNYSIVIKIWNDGPEIDKKRLNNIFEKYNKGYEGNYGLGLAITKLVVGLHGGAIWASNEENGVAFYIKL